MPAIKSPTALHARTRSSTPALAIRRGYDRPGMPDQMPLHPREPQTRRPEILRSAAVKPGLTGAIGGRILRVIAGRSQPPRRSGRVMSSEYATEQVPLAEIQEGDTIQDPESGQWFTVTRTADGTTSVTDKHSDGDTTGIEGYRVYYGDERQGEQVDSRCVIDSRFTKGLVTRQVRE